MTNTTKYFAAGAVDCIRKPFDDIELITRVKTALALHDALKEIKENEESIHTNNQFLYFLMDVAPNPIFFMDKAGAILGCNQGFEKLIGKAKPEIIESTIHDLLPRFQIILMIKHLLLEMVSISLKLNF